MNSGRSAWMITRDKALRTVAHLAENVNKSLTIVSGSFGRRAANFEPALIQALKQCDSGSNVSHHHFDCASLAGLAGLAGLAVLVGSPGGLGWLLG